jgi:hypothetical protein
MNRLRDWLDNPILIKHVRSRLRRQPTMASGVVVFMLALCVLFGGYQLDSFVGGTPFIIVLSLQGLLLTIMGASQIATSAGGARESGILDFHRVSPLSPHALVLGFLFGAPVREYALAALLFPFAFICAALADLTMWGFAQATITLILATWFIHAFTLLNALSLKKARAGGRALMWIVGYFYLTSLIPITVGFGVNRSFRVLEESPPLPFFGIELPWLLTLVIYEAPILGFVYIALVRKMASEAAHALSKRQAIACMATLTVLLLGGLWNATGVEYVVVGVLYAQVTLAILLILMATPNFSEYARGIRRAERLGQARPGAWDDLGLNRPLVAVLCAIVLVGTSVAREFIEGREPLPGGRVISYSLAIAIGVFVVAYFGLALQFFHLMTVRGGAVLMGLFLFVIWLLPLLVGSIATAAGAREESGQIVLALSPVAGLALSTIATSGGPPSIAVRAAALCPALIFALVFNNLVPSARRRAEARIAGTAPPQTHPDFASDVPVAKKPDSPAPALSERSL